MVGAQIVVTCEHASKRLPAAYGSLGLSASALGSHIAWDRGAAAIAAACAGVIGCHLHRGRYSRLLVDLNRSLGHPRLIPAHSFGVAIPGNTALSASEKRLRVSRYYAPYRSAVLADLERVIRRHGLCLHLSVHSFAPRPGDGKRQCDIGLLYDPARSRERTFVRLLAARLEEQGLRVRRNYPYRGTSDGLATHCRRAFGGARYVGIEIEVNQRRLGSGAATAAAARAVVRSVAAAVRQSRLPDGRRGEGNVE